MPNKFTGQVGLEKKSVEKLFVMFAKIVASGQEEANEKEVVGGPKFECEADEVALRCKVIEDASDSRGFRIRWLRYIGLVRRGSSRVVLNALPDRDVSGSGQGGGGALSHEELEAFY